MKKWEQPQLTLDNSKSKGRQGYYQNKTQKFFIRMRVYVAEYVIELSKISIGFALKRPVKEFCLLNVFIKGLYGV